MPRRSVAALALIQVGLVVFGYLFTVSAVKFGGFGAPHLDRAPWPLRMEWRYGYLLMAVPALWTALAMYAQHKDRDDLLQACCVSGIVVIALMAQLFVYCVWAGMRGPPMPLFYVP